MTICNALLIKKLKKALELQLLCKRINEQLKKISANADEIEKGRTE